MMKIRKCLFLWFSVSFMALGCRHASIQENADWPNPGPVDVASLPPIQNVINHGTTDPDKLLQQKDLQRAHAAASDTDSATHLNSAPPIILGATPEEQPRSDSPSSPVKQAANESAPSSPPTQTLAPVEATQAASPTVNDLPTVPGLPSPPEISPPTALIPPKFDKQTQQTLAETTTPATTPPNADSPIPTSVPTPMQTPSAYAAPVSGDANQDSMGIRFDGLSPTAVSAGRVAAHVGTEIITVYDLNIAIMDWIKANVPQGQTIPAKDRLLMAKMVLTQMIDRMLIIQEAHRMMKSEKQKEALFKQIDQVWIDQQIPPMMKKYKVETTYELDQVLKKQGRSLEKAKKEFTNDALAHEFMGMKLGGKTFVSLVEMRRYYNEHINDFNETAKITWREIRVAVDPTKKPEADAESQKILKELQQHSDFATLAKRSSKGATADQGGLWETSPDGYAVKEVNSALQQMKPGQMAGPVVTAESIYFLKLESKRDAGPSRFDEVQTQIQEKLRNEKLAKASSDFILELRKNTLVQTIFDEANLRATNAAANRDSNLSRTVSQTSASQAAPTAQSVSASPQQTNDSTAASSQSINAASGTALSGSGHLKVMGFPPLTNPANRVPEPSEPPQPEPPPALAPSGAAPLRGMMKGPSQPSPL